jgi:predicted  nucleic acid-binding Zn-ribbon protein
MSKYKHRLFINASHTFPIRNRCTNCGKAQFEFYRDHSNAGWQANLKWKRNHYNCVSIIDWVQDTNYDYIRAASPNLYRKYGYYAHSLGFKTFDPRLFRTFSNWNGRYPMGSDILVIVCSNCGDNRWAYMSSGKAALPENVSRKARHYLPVTAGILSKFW